MITKVLKTRVDELEIWYAESLRILHYYPRLSRLHGYVEHHLAEGITLSRAAAVVCLEEKYFSAFFHKKVGLRFTEWRHLISVKQAIRLFGESHVSVGDVARLVGFGNIRTFERVFKRFVGMSPSQFRRTLRPTVITYHT